MSNPGDLLKEYFVENVWPDLKKHYYLHDEQAAIDEAYEEFKHATADAQEQEAIERQKDEDLQKGELL